MAFQVILNFFIAFLWMFLSMHFTLSTFIVGFILGIIMILMMNRFIPGRFYMGRVWALVKLFFLFLKELLLANFHVLALIIQPKMPIRPAIFALPTVLEKDWEVTLLSNLITLTPGTLVVAVSEDSRTLFIHALDYGDAEEAIDAIRNTFERAILEVSRS